MNLFKNKIENIQKSAREHIENGALTSTYRLDREKAVSVLNEALATELVCVLRYRQNWQDATGIESGPIADEFYKHSTEEQAHADRIAQRISQLGGTPDFSPQGLKKAHVDFFQSDSLSRMIEENMVAERVAVDTYRMLIDFFGQRDSTTRRMLEEILAEEEGHADELADLLSPVREPTQETRTTQHLN